MVYAAKKCAPEGGNSLRGSREFTKRSEDTSPQKTPCDPKPCENGYQPDPCADARSRWAREPRTASGILSRVAWCIRCLLPLLPQPSAALLSQMATHAVRPPFTGDPRHDYNIPFGGRGPLHGRRSRGVGNRVHSTPARAPYRHRPSPY